MTTTQSHLTLPLPLLLILLLIQPPTTTAQSIPPSLDTTTNPTNQTLLHGWVPEPPGRGTYSLLWTSLATITLCTWSTLHLNVTRPHSWWRRFRHKLLSTLLLTIAPEVGLAISVGNSFRARRLLRELGAAAPSSSSVGGGRADGGGDAPAAAAGAVVEGWTMTHMLFACADGFWKRTPPSGLEGASGSGCGRGWEGLEPCSGQELVAGIRSGLYASPPSVCEAELKSRSRSDWAVKTIAVLQIFWFVVQLLVRVGVGYQATALEIMTAAYVVCSLLTYGFAWGAPQNVEFPIVVEEDRERMRRVGSGGSEGSGVSRPLSKEAAATTSTAEIPAAGTTRLREHEPWGWLIALPMGSMFGAIHCLAWHAPFPTRVERDIWRVCSGIVTGLPLFITPEIVGWRFLHTARYLNMFARGSEVFLASLVGYTLARLLIIILAVISVRVLPADAYQTVNWSQYIPHFGV